jgi:hypothetical protein
LLDIQKETQNPLYVLQLLLTAESNKRRAATAMNERSRSPNQRTPTKHQTPNVVCSRAHSILTLRMSHPWGPAQSRLVIADLGGCERVAQVSSGAMS